MFQRGQEARLSPKSQRILEFLRQFIREKSYPPSIRDIVKSCQLSSTSVAEYHLRLLEKAGFLRRDREVSRGIELLGERRGRVPLLGVIAAGQPLSIPTEEAWEVQPLDYVEVGEGMLKGRGQAYALRVEGTSMVDAFINDGDIVILEPARVAEDGDMVAAWLKKEGEITLKRLYQEGERIRLQPANSQMAPIYTRADNLEVQGKVIGVVRQVG